MPEAQAITVAQYLKLINTTLATIPSDQIKIVGEIVEHRVSQGKWINFDLKDEEQDAKISCFATTFNIKTPLEGGMKVEVTGYPKVYERFGKFSLNVQTVELVGEGALAKAYLLLKKRLEKEGLFDITRKRELPRFPARIGLITSSGAAAYGDFLRILNNRWSGVEIIHANVTVQGQHALNDIISAFQSFETMERKPEVLVLTRGGGSLEDLHAFNDESVARAVFSSSIPVIVGVGHERDESLCDFVCDIRASTPSNAAERIVPDRVDILRELGTSTQRMEDVLVMRVQTKMRHVDHAAIVFERFIDGKMHDLRITIERFGHAFERFRLSLVQTRGFIEQREKMMMHRFSALWREIKSKTEGLMRLFASFDAQRILDRGYSIVRAGEGIIKNPNQITSGEVLQITLAKGKIDAIAGKKEQQRRLL
jgi:exodeoxyribonuclease VII large subunit